MIETWITIIGGIVLLLFSTKTLIKLSETLSLSLRLSPLFIGMTVIAIGTSLPELSVSAIATVKGDVNLAVGNIIGSNIINILLVFSVGVLMGDLKIGTTKTPRNAVILLLITLGYTYLQHVHILPTKTLGLILLGASFLLTFFEYQWAVFGRTHEDNRKFHNLKMVRFTFTKSILLTLSVIGVIAGGFFIVTSVERLSLLTGLSTGVLGLTLTAVATSLPELLTTIFSQKKHEGKLTIGNIIGSNMYNLLLIGGVINLLGNNNELLQINWITLNVTTTFFVALILFYKGKTVPKQVGVISLAFFIMYMLLETHKVTSF